MNKMKFSHDFENDYRAATDCDSIINAIEPPNETRYMVSVQEALNRTVNWIVEGEEPEAIAWRATEVLKTLYDKEFFDDDLVPDPCDDSLRNNIETALKNILSWVCEKPRLPEKRKDILRIARRMLCVGNSLLAYALNGKSLGEQALVVECTKQNLSKMQKRMELRFGKCV